MSVLDDFHSYDNVLVSGVEYDFSANRHERIPQRLYADWAALLVKLSKVVFPAFAVPPLPEYLFFETESIPSDGPYSSSADYYMLDYVSFEQKAENGCALKIHYENGRWGSDEPICMETSWQGGRVSSLINKDEKSPLAGVYLQHEKEKSAEIAEIIARHRAACLSRFIMWKTKRDTFLVQKKFHTIPFIYGDIGLAGGERFTESAEYVETDFSGQIVKKYGAPYPFSIEDEMTVSNIYRVIDNCFYEFYYSHYSRYEPEITTKLLLSELELLAGALPFDEAILFD